MIIAWTFFILGLFLLLVWLTEFIPSMSTNKKNVGIYILIWLLVTVCSAQYIWG